MKRYILYHKNEKSYCIYEFVKTEGSGYIFEATEYNKGCSIDWWTNDDWILTTGCFIECSDDKQYLVEQLMLKLL